jgi:septum formation protein
MTQQTNQPRIILASQSPQRRTMMDIMMLQCAGGIPYEVLPADIDELAITGETQFERAALVAQGKGREIVKRVQQESAQPFAVLAADTYLADANDKALEKPTSLEDAKAMLRFQSGKTITEYTGVYWYQSHETGSTSAADANSQEFSETYQTQVTFRELSDQEIEIYVQNEPVLTFSGAFCPAYPAGAALIKKIDGSFTGFTHGFPIEFFVPKLEAFLT